MAIVPLFKHRKVSIRIVGPSLRCYQFTQHRYFSQIPEEITELKKLVGQCGIYIDPKEPTIDTEAADPVSIMQKNMRQQLLEELRGQGVHIPDSMSDRSTELKGSVNTSSSTIMNNSGAERVEEQRLQQRADEIEKATQVPETAPPAAQMSHLDMLERLKAASQKPA